jgi:hypothetical protein
MRLSPKARTAARSAAQNGGSAVPDLAATDPFAALYPPGVEALRVAWHHLRVPGPPPGYGLAGDELDHPDPRRRFARRCIQHLACGAPGSEGGETLALIDKASPHSLFDLMLSEVSAPSKSTAADVSRMTGLTLWRTGLNFVHFCEQAAEEFGLAGGELQLALNCDPNTWDRESVQAAKQFHLHLLYWPVTALAPLARAQTLGEIADRALRRQALDPLSFLGARLVTETLEGRGPGPAGLTVRAVDDEAVLAGRRPIGAVLELPSWDALASPDFEDLVRHIHRRLAWLAARLLESFTGHRDPPPTWHRHPLLPIGTIEPRIATLPFSDAAKAGLLGLARVLRGLDPRTARRLARVTPPRRMGLMTLNQPCYALNLRAATTRGPANPGETGVHLIIQPKLFSGIGGAGLLALGGVPSVRVLRGHGTFSAADWEQRARFQRAFAAFNQGRLEPLPGVVGDAPRPSAVRRFAGPTLGWIA